MSKTTRVRMPDRGSKVQRLPTITTVFTGTNNSTLRIENGLLTEVEMSIDYPFALALVGALAGHFDISMDSLITEVIRQRKDGVTQE